MICFAFLGVTPPRLGFMGAELDPKGEGTDRFFLPSGPEYEKLEREYRAGTTQDILCFAVVLCLNLRHDRVRLGRNTGVA